MSRELRCTPSTAMTHVQQRGSLALRHRFSWRRFTDTNVESGTERAHLIEHLGGISCRIHELRIHFVFYGTNGQLPLIGEVPVLEEPRLELRTASEVRDLPIVDRLQDGSRVAIRPHGYRVETVEEGGGNDVAVNERLTVNASSMSNAGRCVPGLRGGNASGERADGSGTKEGLAHG